MKCPRCGGEIYYEVYYCEQGVDRYFKCIKCAELYYLDPDIYAVKEHNLGIYLRREARMTYRSRGLSSYGNDGDYKIRRKYE